MCALRRPPARRCHNPGAIHRLARRLVRWRPTVTLAPLSPAERIFGPLLPDRACGDCTACCTVPAIAPLNKPADTTCLHCVAAGCSIYAQRPEPCRTFFCGWRRLARLTDDLRPDRCGAIVMLETDFDAPNPFDRVCFVIRWLEEAPVLDSALTQRLKRLLAGSLVPIFVSPYRSERKLLIHPAPEIYHAITSKAPVPGKLKADVDRWKSALKRRARAT